MVMIPYKPESLPLKKIDWPVFIRLIGPANAARARFDGILQGIINPSVLLSPLATQEAVLSSKIEGTISTLEEVLEFEASNGHDIEKNQDIREILNYRRAIWTGVDSLKERPISLNLILDLHHILMDSVRGRNKSRGRFRIIQNWIGSPGSPIAKATYIPPEPANLMGHMSDFERYIHYDEVDRLVQLAIIHAQFELIHPFLDGNGRLGRMLVPLFLYEKGLLSSPMFYISGYLESHRELYYERLKTVSEKGDWENWILFFLTAVIEQAKLNTEKAKAIISLYETKKSKISALVRSQFSIQAVDALFDRPIFKTTDFVERSKIPRPSALRILNTLQKENILVPLVQGSGRRATVLMFAKLIAITEGRDVV